MQTEVKPTNQRSVNVEVNGQQQQLIDRLAASDPLGRSAEELIRLGFLEFAKRKRVSAR